MQLRAAKAGGGIESLYGEAGLMDAPWPVHVAIQHGMSVLGWLELGPDDAPAEHLWLNDEAISEHFDRVRAKWKTGGSSTSKTSAAPDFDTRRGEIHQNPMAEAIKAQLKGK